MVKFDRKGCKVEYRRICSSQSKPLKIMIVRPEKLSEEKLPGVLWLHGGYHAFDLMEPDDSRSIRATEKFCEAFMYAKTHYFAPQEKQHDEE
jgi:hypothetical protein